MEVLCVNADQKVINIASMIGRHLRSWSGWYALHIELDDITDDLYKDCVVWTRSIVDSYLKNVQGGVYLCDNKNINIICKTDNPRALHYVGEQICDLVEHESDLPFNYNVYDLKSEGHLYTQNILDRANYLYSQSVYHASPNKGIVLNERFEQKKITKSLKIMLVEDDVITRWMIRTVVKNEGELITADTANKAYGAYSSNKPDIVFLDINLPDGSGLSVLDWIMRNDPGACVVMFSSEDSLDNISNALENGAKGFIRKPFVKEDIYYYIRDLSEIH